MQDPAGVSDSQPAPSDFKGFPPGFNPRLVTPKRQKPESGDQLVGSGPQLGHVGYSPDFKATPPPFPTPTDFAAAAAKIVVDPEGPSPRRALAPLLTHVKDWPEEQERELAALVKVAGLMQKLEGLNGGPLGFYKPVVRIDWYEHDAQCTVSIYARGSYDAVEPAIFTESFAYKTWAQAAAVALEAAWDKVP